MLNLQGRKHYIGIRSGWMRGDHPQDGLLCKRRERSTRLMEAAVHNNSTLLRTMESAQSGISKDLPGIVDCG